MARDAAHWLTARILASEGPFRLVLSGGSTPKRLYQILAGQTLPCDRLELFWGDERFVPPDHPDNNARMVREAWLDRVPIPSAHIHPMEVSSTPEQAAANYEILLRGLPPRPFLFDVTFLGLGEDGHTASLFPGTIALEEAQVWVRAVIGAKPEPRLTLTYPALQSSADVAFLVVGAGKRAMLQRLLAADATIPAGRLRPAGRLTIFADQAAVGP